MSTALIAVIVIGFLILLVGGLMIAYFISMYNSLVGLKRRVDQAKQNIDVLLKQRQDELSKLIDAAAQAMGHEEDVLTALTQAREQAEAAESPTEQAEADEAVRTAMAGFNARVEAYPELRSQENMLQFQERISDLESQIADRREFYNEVTTRYNTRIGQFPYLVFAQQFNFEAKELFTASEEDKEDVDVGAAFEARA